MHSLRNALAYTRETCEIDRENEARARDPFFIREREYGMDQYARFGPPPLSSSASSMNLAIAESSLQEYCERLFDKLASRFTSTALLPLGPSLEARKDSH